MKDKPLNVLTGWVGPRRVEGRGLEWGPRMGACLGHSPNRTVRVFGVDVQAASGSAVTPRMSLGPVPHTCPTPPATLQPRRRLLSARRARGASRSESQATAGDRMLLL